jgi:hypothetical protein
VAKAPICEVIGELCAFVSWQTTPVTIGEWASQLANGPVLASGVELLVE